LHPCQVTASKRLAAAVGFTVQVVIGAALFLVVFLAAVAIAAVIHYFEGMGIVPKWLGDSAKIVEIAIWAVDILVFALFLASEVVKAIRTFFEEFKEGR